MASLVWTSVFAFLILELILTFILVIPVPRKIRNFLAGKIFKFHLGKRLARPLLFIGIALAFALLESYFTHRRILGRIEEEAMSMPGGMIMTREHERAFHGHDRERKYKSERNMYLAGFSLTLLFVIGRITRLMEEGVELEAEIERVRLGGGSSSGGGSSGPPEVSAVGTGKEAGTAVAASASAGESEVEVEVEMKTIRKNPGEKKKD
jgi:hypothetical protein